MDAARGRRRQRAGPVRARDSCTGQGLGIPIDNVKAYVWLNVAAAQDVPGAASARDSVLPRLTPAELQEAQAEARRLSALYIPKAAAAK